jgi:hypothetical protein
MPPKRKSVYRFSKLRESEPSAQGIRFFLKGQSVRKRARWDPVQQPEADLCQAS